MSDLFVHHYGPSDGAPLLAIHGVSAHGRRFLPMAPVAFPGARVIGPDLRGHGQSTFNGPGTIETHIADLLAVLDAEGVDVVTVVAHSFGACLATNLLATAPERVRAVVLLDPAMGLTRSMADERSNGMINSDRGYPSLDALVEARRFGRSEASIPFSDADTRLVAVERADGWRVPWDHEIVADAWVEMARPLPTLAVARPTILLEATQAGLVGPSQRDHLRSSLGDAFTLEQFDLGHMLYWDDFDAVCSSVRSFLSVHAPDTVGV